MFLICMIFPSLLQCNNGDISGNLGVEYVIQKESGKCDIHVIPENAEDMHHGHHPHTLKPDNPDHIHMAHGKDLMGLGKLNFKYQGKVLYREKYSKHIFFKSK